MADDAENIVSDAVSETSVTDVQDVQQDGSVGGDEVSISNDYVTVNGYGRQRGYSCFCKH